MGQLMVGTQALEGITWYRLSAFLLGLILRSPFTDSSNAAEQIH